MSFLSSLFGGSSPELNALIGQFGQAGNKSLNEGQKNVGTATKFWDSIVGGDATKQAQALSPEISSAKISSAEDRKTTAQEGARSGGTAAHNAAANDKVHSYITNLIGSLTNSSASSLASTGSNQVSQGSALLGQEEGAVQQRMENWKNSILGKGITGAVSTAESAGLGAAVGALPGGVGAGAGAGQAVGINSTPSYSAVPTAPDAPSSFFDSLFSQPQAA